MNEDKMRALTIAGDGIIGRYGVFVVYDNASLGRAAEALSIIRGYLKDVETTRQELVKPFNDGVKALNAKFHALTAPKKALDDDITKQMVAYRSELEAQRAEQQKQLDAEARANLTEDALIPEAIAPIVPEQSKSVQTMDGKITFVKVRKWELINIKEVPLIFLTTNDEVITERIKAGFEIPGIRSWTTEIPQARR